MEVAVLIPCYNEEQTVAKVIADFKGVLPSSKIYVYDNNSTDETYNLAKKAGAIVRKEENQGKGNVVRAMFRDIDADVYIIVDGDDTYPAEYANELIDLVINKNADMVIGDRLSNGTYGEENKRGFHNFGNNLVKGLINRIFKSNINDIMTGYRAFSKKFVKTIPVMSKGFQVETELTITSLVHRYNIKEVPIIYRDRPLGSESKLNTFSDGYRVLVMLFDLCKGFKPLLFFGIVSAAFSVLGLIFGVPVIYEFIVTSLISKMPSAILASSLFIISFIIFVLGVMTDHISNKEKRDHELYVNNWIYNEKKENI